MTVTFLVSCKLIKSCTSVGTTFNEDDYLYTQLTEISSNTRVVMFAICITMTTYWYS